MKKLCIAALACALLALAACSGGGGNDPDPNPTTGTISGTLTIGGPVNNAVEVMVGLFAQGSTTPVQETSVGRVASAATGSMSGRDITFSFTQVPYGTYEVAAYAQPVGGDAMFYYRSEAQTISATNSAITGFTDTMSFAGDEPWGTISGVIDIEGDWPSDQVVFVGFTPEGGTAPLQYPVTENQPTDGFVEHNTQGQVIYNIANLGYGSWTVGFYGYDMTTHEITTYGERDEAQLVHGGDPNLTNVNFPADFAGDPGEDPDLGSISGTLTLNGPLPAGGGFLSIGANTIPPQPGAPIGSFDIAPGDEGQDNTIDFVITDMPPGEYSIGVFNYDFATHTAVYFGSYDGTVTITEQDMHVTGIDFNGDVSLID